MLSNKRIKKDRKEAQLFVDSLKPDQKQYWEIPIKEMSKIVPDFNPDSDCVYYKDPFFPRCKLIFNHKWETTDGGLNYNCSKCGKIRI